METNKFLLVEKSKTLDRVVLFLFYEGVPQDKFHMPIFKINTW